MKATDRTALLVALATPFVSAMERSDVTRDFAETSAPGGMIEIFLRCCLPSAALLTSLLLLRLVSCVLLLVCCEGAEEVAPASDDVALPPFKPGGCGGGSIDFWSLTCF